VSAPAVFICYAEVIATERRVLRCRTCKTRRRFVTYNEGWYGTRFVCCTCGDQWQGGERLRRRSRKPGRTERDAAERARAAWPTAMTRDEAREAFREWMKDYTA